MGYTFKVYVKDGREYFEFGAGDLSTTKKDFEFPQSLLDLLYLDFYGLHGALVERMGRTIDRIYKQENLFEDVWALREGLAELAKSHIYFELLRLDWDRRLNEYQEKKTGGSALLPHKKVTHLTANIQAIQAQITNQFATVLDVLLAEKKMSVQQRMTAYYRRDLPPLARFAFQSQTTNFEPVDSDTFTEVLYPQDIYELIGFFLRACVRRETPMRVCKSCGKYFAVTGYANAEYCNREFKDSGKTCKEVGAVRVLQNKLSTDPVHKAYSRAYKTRFARIKYRMLSKESFYAWSAEARKLRDQCLAGEITLEAFQRWLEG
jgi:hypothetical protein